MRRQASLTALGLTVVLLALASLAEGHAQFVTSTPRPNQILQETPTGITVSLTEEVASGSASLRVTDSTGVRLDANGTRTQLSDPRVIATDLPELPAGVYTVAWSATSAVDGHYSAGSFAFAVQDANGSIQGMLPQDGDSTPAGPVPAQVALRIAAFLTLALAVGGAALAALVWAPAARRGDEESRSRSLVTLRFLLLWAGGNAAAFVAVTLSWLAYSLGAATADGATVSLSTPFNLSMLARMAFAGAAAGLLLWARRRPALPIRALDPLLLSGLCAVLGAVAATSGASHAAADADLRAVGAALDAVHLGAVTTWVGGLFALAVVRTALTAPHTAAVAAPALERFSRMATCCVALALAAGVALAAFEVESFDRLLSTSFGNVVLAKAFLFVPLVLLGAWNRVRYVPKLERPSRRAPAVRHILWRVRLEVALGASILVLAGLLTALSPAGAPPPPSPEPFVLHQTQGDLRFDFTCSPTPSVPQVYSLQVTLWNATTGAEVAGASNMTVRFTLLNSTLAPSTILLDGPHGNHFFTDTPALSQPGTWRLEGRVRLSGGGDHTFTFQITLRGA